jgi:uncharacterized membrane protein
MLILYVDVYQLHSIPLIPMDMSYQQLQHSVIFIIIIIIIVLCMWYTFENREERGREEMGSQSKDSVRKIMRKKVTIEGEGGSGASNNNNN